MGYQGNSWVEMLKKWAEIQPEKVIFKEAGKEGLTYQEFYRQVCSVADGLLNYFDGKMPEEPIAVAVDRDVPSLVLIFGVCAAGGWYSSR